MTDLYDISAIIIAFILIYLIINLVKIIFSKQKISRKKKKELLNMKVGQIVTAPQNIRLISDLLDKKRPKNEVYFIFMSQDSLQVFRRK